MIGMQKFTTLTGIAAPLIRANIDTDTIIPMQWLVTASRAGLGRGLFGAWRYQPEGGENPEFVLNQRPYRDAKILIAGANFGCGSSREHASWALLEFGIRCIIAPGFASIFHGNCIKNGILPVTLPQTEIESLAALAAAGADAATFTVDLIKKVVIDAHGRSHPFELAAAYRAALLEGLDEIEMTLAQEAAITAFQRADLVRRPWIYPESKSTLQ